MLEERLDAAIGASDPRERAALAAEAGDQLAVHVAAEEDVFYPALRAGYSYGELAEFVDDHAALKSLLAELIGLAADDPSFEARLRALRTHVEHHHAEEEARVFPAVRRGVGTEHREALGRDILMCQRRLLRAGQPRCATEPRIAMPASPPLLVPV